MESGERGGPGFSLNRISSFLVYNTKSDPSKPVHPTSIELKPLTSSKSVLDFDNDQQPSKTKKYEAYFLSVLTDPIKRNRFRERLAAPRRKEQGLDFFLAVIERDRGVSNTSGPDKCYEATLEVLREFILPDSPHRINLPAGMVMKLLSACLSQNRSFITSDDFFHEAAILSTSELQFSPDFANFMAEELSSINPVFNS